MPQIYSNNIEPVLNIVITWLQKSFPQMNIPSSDILKNVNDPILSFIKSISSSTVKAVMGIAGWIPSFFIKFLFTIVSSFFFTIDYYKINDFILRQFSEKNQKFVLNIKKNGIDTILKFLKAYSILISITFLELAIGLSILQVQHSILFAALIAIIDILPVLGTGSILLPWAAVSFVKGNIGLSIGLLVIYFVILIIRQILEPKIVGHHIGLHPLVTLICMFAGAQLLGFIGLFLFPILATMLKNMNDEHSIHIFK